MAGRFQKHQHPLFFSKMRTFFKNRLARAVLRNHEVEDEQGDKAWHFDTIRVRKTLFEPEATEPLRGNAQLPNAHATELPQIDMAGTAATIDYIASDVVRKETINTFCANRTNLVYS